MRQVPMSRRNLERRFKRELLLAQLDGILARAQRQAFDEVAEGGAAPRRADLEGQEVLKALVDRFPTLELAEEPWRDAGRPLELGSRGRCQLSWGCEEHRPAAGHG